MKSILSVHCALLGITFMGILAGCGPVRPPANAYQDAQTLLDQMNQKRSAIESFRFAGSIDHIQKQRIRGTAFIFATLPDDLRIDVLSPFGTTLSVLTADKDKFGLSDYREGRFFTGKPLSCNVFRFIGVALPPKDMITILIGKVPLIAGKADISWHPDGHYIVTITGDTLVQTLHIGADKTILPLLRAELTENGKLIFDVSFELWRKTGSAYLPYEIRIKMPKDNAELFVQYDEDGAEVNVDLPGDAFEQTIPAGSAVEKLVCSE